MQAQTTGITTLSSKPIGNFFGPHTIRGVGTRSSAIAPATPTAIGRAMTSAGGNDITTALEIDNQQMKIAVYEAKRNPIRLFPLTIRAAGILRSNSVPNRAAIGSRVARQSMPIDEAVVEKKKVDRKTPRV